MAAKTEDIRRKQRFSDYTNAFEQLREAWRSAFGNHSEMFFMAVNYTYQF